MKIALTFLILASFCATASAQTQPSSSSKTVKGSGCVEAAVEHSCRVVIDSKTGELYNLLFSAKAPKNGTAIKFAGSEHHGASSCMQGKPVNITKWKKEKGIKCPPPVIAQTLTKH